MKVRAEISHFIQTDLLNGSDNILLNANIELIETGIVDSLGIMKLLSFLEEKFSIRISGEYLMPENFQTIEKISQLVEKVMSTTEVLDEF